MGSRPCLTCGQVIGIETGACLACPGRKRRNCRRELIVSEVVQKYLCEVQFL